MDQETKELIIKVVAIVCANQTKTALALCKDENQFNGSGN